jgi:HSP20 family molecular chaperone IbpA
VLDVVQRKEELIMTDRNELAAGKSESHACPVAPAIDVFEEASGITLLADMPGVSRDALDVKLDGDTLTVEGRVELELPADMRAVWAEVQAPRFRRIFTLSRELDSSRIDASLKDGVLTLRVPKQAHAQPRRIEVKSA